MQGILKEMCVALRLMVHLHLAFDLIELLSNLLSQHWRQLVACGDIGVSIVLVAVVGVIQDDS